MAPGPESGLVVRDAADGDGAHRLYERLGYRRGPGTRALGDKSGTVERYYRKEL